MSKDEITCVECGCVMTGDVFSADPQRRRFFAMLRDVHGNLPDHLRQRWPSSETLRKHALIAVGHCDVMTVVAGSKTAAPSIAAAFRSKDSYCIVDVRGDVLTIYTAKSMARRFLLKAQFHEVASKVWDWIYKETGIDASGSEAA